MTETKRQGVSALVVAALLVQAGCGAIIYPNRRGTKGGRIDAGVAVLDGIGLLFFIIPGVIAFAVDFGTGCIYYNGERDHVIHEARFDPRAARPADVERLIAEKTGTAVRFGEKDMTVVALGSADELPGRFAQARVASAR